MGVAHIAIEIMEIVLCLLLFGVATVAGYSSGPPTSVCGSLRPSHPGTQPSGNGGYTISTNMNPNPSLSGYQYSAGQTYTGEIA